MASELSQALKELNFTCSENLLQWPFDVPETRPIMQWLVESLNPAVVASLSPEEARMIHLINGDLKLLASVKQGKPPTRHNNLNGHLRGEMEMSKLSKTLIEIDDKIESVKNKISEIEDVQLELKKAAHNGYTELSDKAKQVESELLKSSNIISKSFEYSPPDDNAATRLAAIQIPSDITKPLGQGDESEDMNKMEALRAAALSEVVIHKAWKEYYLARNRPSEVAGGDGDATLDEKLLTSIRFKVATCKLMCKCLASSNSQALRVAILEYSLHKATQLHGQFENKLNAVLKVNAIHQIIYLSQNCENLKLESQLRRMANFKHLVTRIYTFFKTFDIKAVRSNGLIDTECPHYRPIANWLGLSNNVPPEIWFKCIQQKLVSLETGKISPVDTSALENAMFRLSPSGTLLRAPVGIFHKQQYILQQLANARNQLERIQAKISELDAKRSEFLSIG